MDYNELTMAQLDDKIQEIPEAGCWIWTGCGARYRKGYGKKWFRGQLWQVHRVSYTLHRGEIPGDLWLDHLCKTPSCINPWHLEAVTPRENLRRGGNWEKSAAAKLARTSCKRGHLYSEHRPYTGWGVRACMVCQNELRQARRLRTRLAMASSQA